MFEQPNNDWISVFFLSTSHSQPAVVDELRALPSRARTMLDQLVQSSLNWKTNFIPDTVDKQPNDICLV